MTSFFEQIDPKFFQDPVAWMGLLSPIIFLLHCLEEWFFGFPEWASRRFGPITTRRFYFVSHIPLVLIVVGISKHMVNFPDIQISQWFALAMTTTFFINALFHISASYRFKEYSPGAVTAALIIVPISLVFFFKLVSKGVAFEANSISALFTGVVVSIFILYSLTWRRFF